MNGASKAQLVEHMEKGHPGSRENPSALAEAVEVILSDLRTNFGERGRAKFFRRFVLEDHDRIFERFLMGEKERPPTAKMHCGRGVAHAAVL